MMKYLSNINEKSEIEGYTFYNLFEYPEFIYGNLNFNDKQVDFCKYPKQIQEEMKEFGNVAINEMIRYNSASCGNRIRFTTNSTKLVFKIQLERLYSPQKIINYNSMGFDVYAVVNGKYIPIKVFAPGNGHHIFTESVDITGFNDICIFLPSYNTIKQMHMAVEEGSYLKKFDYPHKLPVLFYGNSITQGASASKSGNTFPNIVSKILDRDIINLSCSSCCRATENTADLIGKINCHSIVIDYTQNASSIEYFRQTHEAFYKKIREAHPDIKIVLMNHAESKKYNVVRPFDEIVKQTYENAVTNNENTSYFDQIKHFPMEDFDLRSVDTGHYTDWAMNEIAEELSKLLADEEKPGTVNKSNNLKKKTIREDGLNLKDYLNENEETLINLINDSYNRKLQTRIQVLEHENKICSNKITELEQKLIYKVANIEGKLELLEQEKKELLRDNKEYEEKVLGLKDEITELLALNKEYEKRNLSLENRIDSMDELSELLKESEE